MGPPDGYSTTVLHLQKTLVEFYQLCFKDKTYSIHDKLTVTRKYQGIYVDTHVIKVCHERLAWTHVRFAISVWQDVSRFVGIKSKLSVRNPILCKD